MNYTINAKRRDANVKGSTLRKSGWVPACIFGKSTEAFNIQVPYQSLAKCLNSHASKVEVTVEGGETYLASFSEVQKGHMGDSLVHVSFHALSNNEIATLTVPLEFTGTAVGTKSGGVLHETTHEITIKGYPAQLPESVQIDVSTLEVGDSIKLSDFKDQFKFEFADSDDKVFVTCHYAKVQEVEEPAETENVVEMEAATQEADSSDSEDKAA